MSYLFLITCWYCGYNFEGKQYALFYLSSLSLCMSLSLSLSFTLSLCCGVCFAGVDLSSGNRAVFLSGWRDSGDSWISGPALRPYTMVPILDSNSDKSAHVRNNLCNMICLRQHISRDRYFFFFFLNLFTIFCAHANFDVFFLFCFYHCWKKGPKLFQITTWKHRTKVRMPRQIFLIGKYYLQQNH